MSLILDGTAGVTFPSGSGTQAAQSKVLQVVNTTAQYSGGVYFSTTSLSLVSTGLTASITPLFSTSKILIQVSGITNVSGNTFAGLTIYRGSSNLATGTSPSFLTAVGETTGSISGSSAMFILDTPSTTSSTTYTVYGAVNTGGTLQFGAAPSFIAGGAVSITVMEIAQ